METFIVGLFILLLGGSLYGSLCQKVFGPDDRKTPAYVKRDGFDFLLRICFCRYVFFRLR